MTDAIVTVLPEPVTPSSVWYRSPRFSPADSSRIACGWSPRSGNGSWRSKVAMLQEYPGWARRIAAPAAGPVLLVARSGLPGSRGDAESWLTRRRGERGGSESADGWFWV